MNKPSSDSALPTEDDPMLDAPTPIGVSGLSLDNGSETDDLDAPTAYAGSGRSGAAVLTPGLQIDEYELIREIARGGMGVVYLAKQTNLNRFVALKMVLESDSATADELERFENEARAAGALSHPGIVPVYEVGSYQGHPYFSMAFVDGKSLATILNEGPLVPERAAVIARDVAVAISHAHEQKIIHRDIKPANILIDSEGVPRITDFGVCKSLSAQSQLTTQGELIGTPHYMPPEQAGTRDAVVGPESDVYSIGAVMYAMLTARPPFQAPSPIDVVAQVMTKEPVPPSKFAGVPSDLETITMKCLSKTQKDRYATAKLLAEDLDRFLSGEPILAKPPGIVKRFQHAIRRHVFLASVSGSFALLLVIMAILMGIALIRSQANVAHLSELLEIERQRAKQNLYLIREDSLRKDSVSEQSYDVQRLTDAANRFVDDDPQLAIHLAVYAARLSNEHGVRPPVALGTLMSRMAGEEIVEESYGQAEYRRLIELVETKINRELTQFELAVYGLFDPSHKMGIGPNGSSTPKEDTNEPLDEGPQPTSDPNTVSEQ